LADAFADNLTSDDLNVNGLQGVRRASTVVQGTPAIFDSFVHLARMGTLAEP
jgi:hypothetical protein